jgi:hypothetical protein
MSTNFPFNDYVVPATPWANKPAYPYCPETAAYAPENWAKRRNSASYVRLRAGCSARVYGVFLSERNPPDNSIHPQVEYEARLNWLKSSSETPIISPPKRCEYRSRNDTGVTICLECDAAKAPSGEDTIIQPWLMSKERGEDWHPAYTCGPITAYDIISGTSLWVVRLNFLNGEFCAWIVAGPSLSEVRQQRFLTSFLVPYASFDSSTGCGE